MTNRFAPITMGSGRMILTPIEPWEITLKDVHYHTDEDSICTLTLKPEREETEMSQQYTPGESRAAAVRKRLQTLEQELYQLERWGPDTWDDGTILRWTKVFSNVPDKEFHYVSIKADGLWYVTGPTTATLQGVMWDSLIQKFWVTPNPVDEVYIVISDLPLGELRESLEQLKRGEGVEVDTEKLRAEVEAQLRTGTVEGVKLDPKAFE